MTDSVKKPFWKTRSLSEMNAEQWESLCDGCGKCCCIRLEDEENGAIYITDVACKLFDKSSCRCINYTNRHQFVPDCVTLTADNVTALSWMPQTCAYRLLANGQDLPEWHHLVSGSRQTIHEKGMSVQDAVISELDIPEDAHVARIVVWPGEPDIFDED